jgi:hypothetical protein
MSKHYFYVITGSSNYKQAPGSFIFSLCNKENLLPFKAPLYDQNSQRAIYVKEDYGPTFGAVHDIHISDDAASNTGSITNSNSIYPIPSNVTNIRTMMAGSFNFQPSEVEVFYFV